MPVTVLLKHLILSFVGTLIVLFSTVMAVAETAHIEINYVIGDYEIEEIVSQKNVTFSKFDLGKNLGFKDKPVWFRINAQTDNAVDGQHLIITPVHIDNIQVFANSVHGYEKILNAGDRETSPISMIPEGYSVTLTSYQLGAPIYIEIASKNIIYPSFKIVDVSEARNLAITSVFWLSLSFGITLLYFAWATSAVVSSPQLLLLTFILRLAMFSGALFVHSGMWRFLTSLESLPPQDLIHNVTGLAYITVAQLFDFALLRTIYCKTAIKAFLNLVLLSTLAKIVLFISGEVSLALIVNNISALLTLLLGAMMVVLPRQNKIDTSKIQLSRTAVGAYFILQAIPLILLFMLSYFENSNYLRVSDIMFMNYTLVPGGFIAYAMLKHQQRTYRENTELELRAQHFIELSLLEQEKRSEMKRLLETLAHEIKTPLATLQMAKAVGRIDQKVLQKSTDSISAVLNQISRVEHIERGAFVLETTEIDLCSLMKNVLKSVDSSANIECMDIKVNADWNGLYIVLSNLVGNAEKYKKPRTQVAITIEKLSGSIDVLIKNALSRPIVEPDRLFEKYYRDTTNANQPGTGLGLYLAKYLTHAFGAELKILKSDEEFVMRLSFSSGR